MVLLIPFRLWVFTVPLFSSTSLLNASDLVPFSVGGLFKDNQQPYPDTRVPSYAEKLAMGKGKAGLI